MSDCCGNNTCSVNSEDQETTKKGFFRDNREYIYVIISFFLLLLGIVLKEFIKPPWFTKAFQLVLFILAYLPVGATVLWKSAKQIRKGDIFNEFFLMGIATLGAFFLGEYAEGVAVMLFYAIGELLQGAAVKKARRSIEDLLKVQVEEVSVLMTDNRINIKHPSQVETGSLIQVKPGEKLALDGELITEQASFDTAALTGESKPDRKYKGETVLAGMINLEGVITLRTTRIFEDSKLSKILDMVREASKRKAKTQRFITRFAKIYTPIVVFLAVALVTLPFFFTEPYNFEEWLYRALVFLVISCPCALMISIPLGYFGGIGAASRMGILFKGSNYLDQMRKVDTVVMDKTGTLTKGIFKVQKVKNVDFNLDLLLTLVGALESQSTHPVAKAVTEYCSERGIQAAKISGVKEFPGMGMQGQVEEFQILAGNNKLLHKFNIPYDPELDEITETLVVIAINGEYKGYILIDDEIKGDAKLAISELRRLGVKNLVMLSGDKEKVVQKISRELGLDAAFGELMPEEKIKAVEKLKNKTTTLAFVGDGLNDAPVISLSDIGIAMGGLGSHASIETADVVIQNDQPSRIATAIKISRATQSIVWQNIGLAFGIKFLVLILGAMGMATMWEAVIADVGVTILAVLNAIRIQQMDFQPRETGGREEISSEVEKKKKEVEGISS